MTRRLTWLLAATWLTACGTDVVQNTPAPNPTCFGSCPGDLRCYAPTGECVYAGAVACSEPCQAWEQCSARAPQPTCYAQVCSLPPAPPAQALKVLSLALAPPDEACDLDGDGQGDASLSTLNQAYASLPQAIGDAIAQDRITVFFDPTPDHVALLFGTLAPQSLRCNPASPSGFCQYTVTRDSYDRGAPSGACPAWLALANPTVQAERLTAGGPENHAGITVPVGDSQYLMQALGARLDGRLQAPGTPQAQLDFRLCGAVPKREILAALEGLPEDTLAPVGGLPGAQLLLDRLVKADVDADANGEPESVSFAFTGTALQAGVVGWSPVVLAAASTP